MIKIAKVEEEKQPNGIIDLVSKVLSDNAKVQEEKDAARNRMEAAIMTRAAASTAKSTATRSGLTSGFIATKETTEPEKKEVLSEDKFEQKLEAMKKEITNAGSGPDPTKDVNDKLEISPVTEAAAASLD